MRDLINSRDLERQDLVKINDELAAFQEYKKELLAILPINSEEKVEKYRAILKKHLKINVEKLISHD